MWIIPKNLPMSSCAPDTLEYISDLNELSQVSEQSLIARSKPLPVRTWLRRWNRDICLRLLFGRILKPSRGESFVDWWTSCLAGILANRSAQPESAKDTKTPATCGRLLQMELLPCGLEQSSLRMSKVTSASGCAKSLPTWLVSDTEWKRHVANQRGEYLARKKLAHLTREKGSLSWPSITVNEAKNSCGKSQSNRNTPPLGTAVQIDRAGHPDPESLNTGLNLQG